MKYLQTQGTVVATCRSMEPGLCKTSIDSGVVVDQYGIEFDRHNRPERLSHRTGQMKPNIDRQVSIFAHEVYDELNENTVLMREMKQLMPGRLGENLTVRGLGDLTGIEKGTRLVIQQEIVLVVVEPMEPCANLREVHPMIAKLLGKNGRRGLYCRIAAGHGKRIHVGGTIALLPASDAVIPDEEVVLQE